MTPPASASEPRPGLFERLRAGFAANLEIEFLEVSRPLVRVSMAVTGGVLQGLGVVHGGALVTLGDIAATLAAYAAGAPEADHVTAHLVTNFLGPVREGPVVAQARPLATGRRLSVWEVRIVDPRGRVACFLTVTLAAIARRSSPG